MPTAAACRIHKPPRGASERRSRLGLWKPSKAKCFAVSKSRALEEALRVAPGRYGKYRGNRHAVRPVTRMCDLRHRIAVECGVNLHLSEDGSVRAAMCAVNARGQCTGCHMPRVDQGVFHMSDHWIRVHPERGIQSPKRDESLRSQVPPLREFLRIIVVDEQQRAESAAARLAKGDAFFDVAHDLSIDETAPGGGYIGEMWLSEMEPKLAAAGAKLGHGETSGIVDMGNRWMILQRMPRDFKADADDLFERASALKAGGDIKGALEKDQQALRIYPYFLRALIFMGATLGENG